MAKEKDSEANDESSPNEDTDTSQRNIAESAEIISKLTATAAISKRILRQVRSSFETQKMVESSKQMSTYGRDQIRRAKRRD